MTEKGESQGLESAFDSKYFGEDISFHLDEPVGSASISPCGRDVVLASRQGLHVIDLDSPYSPPRHLPHYTPWEVADVQWSPFASRDYWIVSTSNQKALVWNLAMLSSQASIEHVLHAHTRAITDINFSAHHPDILATCAVDSFVHCWDLRHPARPAITFCDWFAGATQVKWNRQESHILASSHDKYLRIWDDRKGAYPLRSIEAHATKIYGVDWNRTETNKVVTCSLDRTIKFWDYTSSTNEPDRTIQTPFPVWRARHTPFGSGLLAMPQRADHDLHLYDRRLGTDRQTKDEVSPVYRFSGHDDQVKEFLWRSRGTVTESVDNRDFQLVSWGIDRILRLHRVDTDILDSVGYRESNEFRQKINFTRKNAKYRTFRDTLSGSGAKTTRDNPTAGSVDIAKGIVFDRSSVLGTGMTSVCHPWGTGRPSGSMVGRGKKAPKEMDAMAWMRGVKIGKRETTPFGMDQSLTSVLSPTFNANKSWDAFENLGEEISLLGDKFAKVAFDEIDVHARWLMLSFHGPWGSDNTSTYLRCRVDFPTSYPNAATPKFDFERTAVMSEEALARISTGVQLIAEAYMARQKSSLEAALRYFLGEQSLEESLNILDQRHGDIDLDSAQNPDLSSSDDDSDGVGGFIGLQPHGMELSEGMLAVPNAQCNVPLPKACGATWAKDGRLVCFFPPKEDKPHSLLDSLALRSSDRSSKSHKPMFEGFGRLHNGSIIPKRSAPTVDTVGNVDSDLDDFSSSSSGSSSSFDEVRVTRHRLLPSMAWRANLFETHGEPSVDDSQRSSGGGMITTMPSKSVNFVSIHNCEDLLPAKKALARGYVISGKPSQSCEINARVAEDSGDHNLASVWSLVNMILQDEVPLELIHHPYGQTVEDCIMVVARRRASRLGKNDSAVDLSFDAADEILEDRSKGSVKWGCHPFGRGWLINSLFQHFERLADVQMLAMLTCVLSEASFDKHATKPLHIDDQRENSEKSGTTLQWFSQSNKVSSGWFPSEDVARSLLRPSPSKLAVHMNPSKGTSGHHSTSSSIGASTSDPITPFSTGATPPSTHRLLRTNFERSDSHTSTISTSPEQSRSIYRSNSNLASAFAASFSRLPSFSASASSSPPTTYSRKRLSPAGSYLGTVPPAVTWGVTSLLGTSSTITEDPKSVYSFSVSDTEEYEAVQKPPAFKINLVNQDQFHNDGYSSVPLLDPNQAWRYCTYREAYTQLLYSWEMSIARCEVLKFNNNLHATSGSSSSSDIGHASSFFNVGRNKVEKPTDNDNLSLGFRSHSTTRAPEHHNQQIRPIHEKQHLICLLCAELIRGLCSPCLACGHVLHASCRSLLLGQEVPITPNGECVAGCGCYCADHSIVEVQITVPDTYMASSTVAGYNSNEKEPQHGWRADFGEDNEDAWEEVAYESLARNLGGRYLTPKTSQIWRGAGESRKSADSTLKRGDSY